MYNLGNLWCYFKCYITCNTILLHVIIFYTPRAYYMLLHYTIYPRLVYETLYFIAQNDDLGHEWVYRTCSFIHTITIYFVFMNLGCCVIFILRRCKLCWIVLVEFHFQLMRGGEEHEKCVCIRFRLKGFRSPNTPDDIIFAELFSLKEYFNYRLSISIHKLAKSVAIEELKLIKASHVQDVPQIFDSDERTLGARKLGMVPFVFYLKKCPLTRGPTAPWNHIEARWQR